MSFNACWHCRTKGDVVLAAWSVLQGCLTNKGWVEREIIRGRISDFKRFFFLATPIFSKAFDSQYQYYYWVEITFVICNISKFCTLFISCVQYSRKQCCRRDIWSHAGISDALAGPLGDLDDSLSVPGSCATILSLVPNSVDTNHWSTLNPGGRHVTLCETWRKQLFQLQWVKLINKVKHPDF